MTTLEQLMAEAGLAGPENELLKAQYLDALKKSRTPQPELLQSRGSYVTPAITQNIASTLSQILGGRDSSSLMQAMSANLKKQQAGRTGLAQAATQPGANLDDMQIMAGAGGDATGSMGTTIGQVDNRQLRQALEMAKQENQRNLLERTLASRQKLAEGEWKLKSDLFTPHTGSYEPEKGGFVLHRGTGQVTKLQPDPAAAAARDARAVSARPPKNLTTKEITDLQTADTTVGNMKSLAERFKPEYSVQITAPLATVAGAVEHAVGGLASKDVQDRDSWWTDWEKFYNLVERHEMFGSAFTATEKQAWAAAQKVRRGASPEIIKAGVEALRDATARWVKNRAEARIKGGFNEPEIREVTKNSSGTSGEAPAPAAHIPTWNPASGKFE